MHLVRGANGAHFQFGLVGKFGTNLRLESFEFLVCLSPLLQELVRLGCIQVTVFESLVEAG
jgi:hypothetical protein